VLLFAQQSTEEDDGSVRIDLSAVRRLTINNRKRLTGERPFRDMMDLIQRTRLRSGESASLILSGAWDGLLPLTPEAYPVGHDRVLRRISDGLGLDGMNDARADLPGSADAP
jgi:hypothetical protein